MTLTDKGNVLQLMETNAAVRLKQNLAQSCYVVRELQWGCNLKRLKPPFDVVLASDVIGCGDA